MIPPPSTIISPQDKRGDAILDIILRHSKDPNSC